MEKTPKKKISLRAAIGAAFFGIGLWIYANFNGIFTTFVPLAIEINLPEGKAIESQLPGYITAKLKGDGWSLLNAIYFRSPNVCKIDLTKTRISKDSADLNRSDLLKAIQLSGNIEVLDVFPENLSLELGEISEKSVPIIPDVKVKLRDGFMLIGNIEVSPKEVILRGSKKALQKIDSWNTEPIVLEDVYSAFNKKITLVDNANNYIAPLLKTIAINGKVDQIAELDCYDVPIRIENAPAGFKYDFSPPFVRIILRGGASEIANVDPSQVSAKIDYASIINDTLGVFKPRIASPGNTYVLKVEPSYVIKAPFKLN